MTVFLPHFPSPLDPPEPCYTFRRLSVCPYALGLVPSVAKLLEKKAQQVRSDDRMPTHPILTAAALSMPFVRSSKTRSIASKYTCVPWKASLELTSQVVEERCVTTCWLVHHRKCIRGHHSCSWHNGNEASTAVHTHETSTLQIYALFLVKRYARHHRSIKKPSTCTHQSSTMSNKLEIIFGVRLVPNIPYPSSHMYHTSPHSPKQFAVIDPYQSVRAGLRSSA